MAKGFARTGADVTSLSDPSLEAASFTQQGVVDRSGLFEGQASAAGSETIAGAISTAGRIADDVDTSFTKASLEAAIQPEIDAFVESNRPGFAEEQQAAFAEASQDLFVLERKREGIRFSEGEEAIKKLDPDFAAVTKKLENAQRQGAISQQEFEIRVRKITREAVNRRPGLLNELTQHAQNVLHLSGARELVAFEQSLQVDESKQREALVKDLTSQLHSENLPFDFIALSSGDESLIQKAQAAINDKRRADQFWEERDRMREVEDNITEDNRDTYVERVVLPTVHGGTTETLDELTNIFSAPESYDAQKVKAGILIENKKSELRQLLSKSKVSGHPNAKLAVDAAIQHLDSMEQRLSNFTSGEDALAQVKNTRDRVFAGQELGVMQKTNLPGLNVLSKFDNFMVTLKLNQPEIRSQLDHIISSLNVGSVNDPGLNNFAFQETAIPGEANLATILKGGLTQLVPKENGSPEDIHDKDAKEFENLFQTGVELISKNRTENPKEAFKAQTAIIKDFGRAEARAYINNTTQTTKQELTDLYQSQAVVLTRNRDIFLDQARNSGVDVKTRILPDGRFFYEVNGGNEITRKRMKQGLAVVAEGYTDLIKAQAVLFNQSIPQTVDMLGEIYGGGSPQEILDALDRRQGEISEVPGGDRFLNNLSLAESGGRNDAANPDSSALGPFQFIKDTWNSVIDRYAPEVREGKSPEEVLELRKDPNLAKQMVVNLTNENKRALSANNVPVTNTSLHIAHILGAPRAALVFQAPTSTPLSDILPETVIKANENIMRNKTAGQFIQWAKGKQSG